MNRSTRRSQPRPQAPPCPRFSGTMLSRDDQQVLWLLMHVPTDLTGDNLQAFNQALAQLKAGKLNSQVLRVFATLLDVLARRKRPAGSARIEADLDRFRRAVAAEIKRLEQLQ